MPFTTLLEIPVSPKSPSPKSEFKSNAQQGPATIAYAPVFCGDTFTALLEIPIF